MDMVIRISGKHESGKVCQFDNPNTMCRELWRDRKLVAHLSAETLIMQPYPQHIPNLHFGFDRTPWKAGKIRGDKKAIGDSND